MAAAENVYQFPDRRDDGQSPGPNRAGRSIQVEDGFTRTANALVEAFARSPLTSREARIIRVVERMTYGWQKPEDWIAASVFSEMTGMSEGKCSEVLNGLIRKRVITRNGGGRSPVRINKRVEEWNFASQKCRLTPKQKPKSDWGKSPQDGVTERPQNGVAPKERKDTNPSSLRSEGGASDVDQPAEPPDAKRQASKRAEYTAEFEAAWSAYPKRSGANPKRDAFKCWRARLAEGFTAEYMTAGVERYAEFIRSKGDERSEFVMQAKRFFGTNAEFENDWIAPAPRANGAGAQGGQYANRPGYDAKRAEQDRIAARLADPYDSGWIDGLFPEEDSATGAGEPCVYPTGSDLPQDMADSVQHRPDADPGQAGGGYLNGEVVGTADAEGHGHGGGAHQGRGRRVAAERGQSGEIFEAEAGGFWNA